jgi:ubiquinone/menaquinone biosynthesis C-methylase UbiE
MIGRFVASQFRKPSGLLGRLIGNGMARRNELESRWTVDLLNIQPDMHVLEIGFGPGVAIQYASEKTVQGHVSGIDYSKTMVQSAHNRNATMVKSGRVDLRQGDVSALPYENDTFERVFTIHCIYFWSEPTTCLREIWRVLRVNGILAITILPKDKWLLHRSRQPSTDVFTLYNSDEVTRLLTDVGFQDVHVEDSPQPDKFPGACILAAK